MDATSIIFVAVIVLLGGPLAYGADWLGRRLGKKRLTIFGLRPRHTAAFLTVAAGILIPLLTVLAMLALSSGVRDWVINGSRALHDKAVLERERDRLVSDIKTYNGQLNDVRRLKAQTEKNLKDEQRLYQQERKLAADLRIQLRDLNAKLTGQQKLLASREREVQRLTSEVRRRTESIKTINSQLIARQSELKAANKSLGDVKGAYKKLDSEYKLLDQNRVKLDQQNQQLQGQIDLLKPEVDSLRKQRAQQQLDLDQANKDLVQAKSDLAAAQSEVLREQTSLSQIERDVTQLVGAFQTQPMIYHKDDEIVRLGADASLSPEDARKAVENLLSLARSQASSRGAEASEDINVVGFARVSGANPMTPLEVQSALTRGVQNLRNPAVMVAFTPINVFKTQPVQLQVRVMPNPLVYRMGQTIADMRIDGRLEPDAIFQQLRIFLSETVTQKAVADQMIPRQGQDTPLGEVSSRQILDVVQAIHVEARVVKLSVLAKQDTRAADPLQIEFKVGR